MYDEMLNLIRGFYLKYWLKNAHLKTSSMARSQLYCTNMSPQDGSDLRKCVFSSLSCYVASICTKCRTLRWMAQLGKIWRFWIELTWLDWKIKSHSSGLKLLLKGPLKIQGWVESTLLYGHPGNCIKLEQLKIWLCCICTQSLEKGNWEQQKWWW